MPKRTGSRKSRSSSETKSTEHTISSNASSSITSTREAKDKILQSGKLSSFKIPKKSAARAVVTNAKSLDKSPPSVCSSAVSNGNANVKTTNADSPTKCEEVSILEEVQPKSLTSNNESTVKKRGPRKKKESPTKPSNQTKRKKSALGSDSVPSYQDKHENGPTDAPTKLVDSNNTPQTTDTSTKIFKNRSKPSIDPQKNNLVENNEHVTGPEEEMAEEVGKVSFEKLCWWFTWFKHRTVS